MRALVERKSAYLSYKIYKIIKPLSILLATLFHEYFI